MDFREYTLRQDTRLKDLPIQYAFIEPRSPQSAVILMPAARTKAQTDRNRAYFPRWSWAEKWPQSLVITLADPVLSAFPRLDGGVCPGRNAATDAVPATRARQRTG